MMMLTNKKKLNVELLPVNGRKSFYGKCSLWQGSNGVYYLQSYNTFVCSYDKINGIFTRLWSGYSDTTKNHVNSFRAYFNLDTINKLEWLKMEV